MYSDSTLLWNKTALSLELLNREFSQLLTILCHKRRKSFAERSLINLRNALEKGFPKCVVSLEKEKISVLDQAPFVTVCFSGVDFFANCIGNFAVGILASFEPNDLMFLIYNPINNDVLICKRDYVVVNNYNIENLVAHEEEDETSKLAGSKYFLILNACLGRIVKPTIEVGDDIFLDVISKTAVKNKVNFV